MTRTRQLGLVAALVAGLLLSMAAPASAIRRYASPTGKTVGPCSSVKNTDFPAPGNGPCTLRRAVEDVAVAGDEVVVLPGTYSLSSNALSVNKSLNIHGADGQPRPLIQQATAGQGAVLNSGNQAGATLRHLQLEAPGIVLHFSSAQTPAIAEDLVVAGAGGGVFLSSGWTLRNSVIRTAGDGVTANSVTVDARNLTVITTAADSAAFLVQCVAATGAITARNVIARGGAFDLKATSGGACGTPTINVSFSNYRAGKTLGAVNDQGNNQTNVDPVFVDQAAFDFHQAAGSPTIDAGTSDSLIGTNDFDGNSRTLGAATDIGADEFVPAGTDPGGGSGGGSGGGGGGDGGGSGGDGGGGNAGEVVADKTLPVETKLKVSPTNVRPGSGSVSIAAKAPKTGAKVSYTLSELGQVTFTVERAGVGRKVGGKCVKQTRSNRTRPKCTRYVKLKGSFDHAAVEGKNSFRFTGRLSRKALKAGGYRLVGTPIDIAGNTGKAATAKFNVVK